MYASWFHSYPCSSAFTYYIQTLQLVHLMNIPMNALQLCRWHCQPDSFHTGVTAEALRAKINDVAQTRSLWSKISGRRGRPPPIIVAPIVRPMNALQLCPDSFHTGVTAEALRAKIDRKSAISHQCGHFDPKFQVQGVAPTNNFCMIS